MQRDVVPRSLKAFSPELSPVFTGVTPVLFLVLSLSVSFFLPSFFFSLFVFTRYVQRDRNTGLDLGGYCGTMSRVGCRDHGSCLSAFRWKTGEGFDN